MHTTVDYTTQNAPRAAVAVTPERWPCVTPSHTMPSRRHALQPPVRTPRRWPPETSPDLAHAPVPPEQHHYHEPSGGPPSPRNKERNCRVDPHTRTITSEGPFRKAHAASAASSTSPEAGTSRDIRSRILQTPWRPRSKPKLQEAPPSSLMPQACPSHRETPLKSARTTRQGSRLRYRVKSNAKRRLLCPRYAQRRGSRQPRPQGRTSCSPT